MRYLRLLLLSFISALVSCDKESTTDPSVLAEVGDTVILVSDLEAEQEYLKEAGRNIGGRHELVEKMIQSETLYQKAKLEGLDQDPEYQRAIRNLLIGRFKASRLDERLEEVEVSEEEIKSVYETEKEAYTHKAQKEVALIKILIPTPGDEEAHAIAVKRMKDALEMARIEGLAKAAAEFSDDQISRYHGGHIGWLKAGEPHRRVPEKVRIELEKMSKPGAFSQIIETEEALYVINLLATKPEKVATIEQVAPTIRRKILARKQNEVRDAFYKECEASVSVTRYEEHWGPDEVEQEAEAQPPELR